MYKYRIIFILVSLLSIQCHSQSIDSLIHLGDIYRGEGNHQQAIIEYEKALKIDRNSSQANIGIAFSYQDLNEFKKAIKYCDRVLRLKNEKTLDAIIIKGSALDYLGKSKKSVRLYNTGIKQFPSSYLLHYNLGITYYNCNQLSHAKEQLIKAIEIDKLQPNSHYVLGLLMNDMSIRAESMLSFYFFLLLEPNTERSVEVIKLLNNLWKQNIEIDSTNINALKIKVNPNKNFSDYNTLDISISEIYATNFGKNRINKDDSELLISNTSSLFSILGDYRGIQNDIWQNLYIHFFNDLFIANQVEPFCYYISTTYDNTTINNWLEANPDRIETFSTWANTWIKLN